MKDVLACAATAATQFGPLRKANESGPKAQEAENLQPTSIPNAAFGTQRGNHVIVNSAFGCAS